ESAESAEPAEPAESAESAEEAPAEPEERIRRAEIVEFASWSAEPFLRWAVLAGCPFRDPDRAYPDVAAAYASQGVELFWPPPRSAALRYFAGFALTILAVCAVPAGLALVGEARKAPGLVDFGDHLVWMARPVAEITLTLLIGAVFLTLLQVTFLRVKVMRAARRFSLPEGERLLALCYARTRHAWPPPEPEPEPEPASEPEPEPEEGESSSGGDPGRAPSEATEGEDGEDPDPAEDKGPSVLPGGPIAVGAPWGEFLAITDRRFLQLLFGEGRNMVLEVCAREDLLALAHLAPASHPLLGLIRHLRSDGRGLRLWTADGRELQIRSEVLFHGPLQTWLKEAGYRIEDWGYLPLEIPRWIRSPADPRRAERVPDPEELAENPEQEETPAPTSPEEPSGPSCSRVGPSG
ncbi:MAG: hypothetical protein JKY65_20380, partial [Planctomycetes bacterium]|nr:hypothetical protein [Planctomycetota bacterium]